MRAVVLSRFGPPDVLPLDRIQEAHARLDTGHGRGKVVVRMG
jgi:hypothetical protein